MTPPVREIPLLEARPPEPTEIPPLKVEVAEALLVMAPSSVRAPAIVEDALETNPLLK